MTNIQETQERKRLEENLLKTKYWKRWGPYLSDRQWGTVREDYSADGTAWDYLPHDHARSRAYRWGEDGIAGICDNHQRLCFAIALWNGEDDILKERLFGLTNREGNHGEDSKEYYFNLDNTPTHSYMKCLYKYPQTKFPYADLVAENGRRKANPRSFEYELVDTDIFSAGRYFDVYVEYAKNSPDDILIQISVVNRGPERKTLHLLPNLWYRNTWSWYLHSVKPFLKTGEADLPDCKVIEAGGLDWDAGNRWLYCEGPQEVLYTENETNTTRFGWGANASSYVKDAFEDYILRGRKEAVNPNQTGTKAATYYMLDIGAGETRTVRLRLSDTDMLATPFGPEFTTIFQERKREADEFYQALTPFPLSDDMRSVQRQTFAGLLWNKQFYHYVVKDWLNGDPAAPPPPPQRKAGRNRQWVHMFVEDILSMPDTWEYPWFAAWDLAFHTIPLALIDPEFAKRQLTLLTREWYMHPNGQIPAYEWAFNDLNPPVHAWAAWRVYKIEEKMYGRPDREFLERVFQKLALYFTWWVNRKEAKDDNIFQGGFLGLDNISAFDRSNIPDCIGGYVDQADGTAWMGMYCLNMLRIALELAIQDPTYDEMASKFFQHFLYIADAMNQMGAGEEDLWDDEDGLYYDILHLTGGKQINGREFVSMKLRSVVGLVPLFAIETIDLKFLQSGDLADFQKRFEWFLQNRPDMTRHDNIALINNSSEFMQGTLLSLVNPEKLRRILQKILDENEFLSPYGIRSLSKFHERNPYILPGIVDENGQPFRVEYAPAESIAGDFGGNSNWRGPVWFPINFLIIEALQKFHRYLGDDFKVECPTGSGKQMTLWEVATELSNRLIHIFLRDDSGNRPVYGGTKMFQEDPNWRDLILFYEYFHGDNGAGLGASHQTGWTGLVAKLIQQRGEYAAQGRTPNSVS
jgi:hypothetical protein